MRGSRDIETPGEFLALSPGDHRMLCPRCSAERRHNRKTRCLSVTVDADGWKWNCWHCGWSGASRRREERFQLMTTPTEPVLSVVEPPVEQPEDPVLSDKTAGWLSKRGISASTAISCGVFSDDYTFHGHGRSEAIWFPYETDGKVYAHKIRTGDSKRFSQAGGANTFWRSQTIEPGRDLFVLEGEMDVLSLCEVGERNAVSVPNGAPMHVREGKIDPSEDRKFQYVWSGKEMLDAASRIVIAVDNDEPGRALGEELARRIGKARCWRIIWPDGCKDANDVLVKLGPEKLKSCISNPEPWPIAGVYDARHYEESVRNLFAGGLGRGLSTGFGNVDELYSVVPGHLAVVTGIPGSGKSTWMNSVMVNMSRQHGWRFAVWSTENTPEVLISQLAALYVEKPFFDNGDAPRLTEAELDTALDWVNEHFVFLTGDGGTTTPDSVIDRLKTAVLRYGVRGALIDPASYLARPPRDGESGGSDSVGQMLEGFKSFAVSHDVAVWLIAHPYKMRPNVDGTTMVPKGYDISGSASWYNRPDFGVSVHRPAEARHVTEIHLWKVRYSWTGKEGKADLYHDRPTGRFGELPFVGTSPVFSFATMTPSEAGDPWDGF